MAQAVRIAYDKVTVDVSGSYALTIGDAGSSPEVQSLTFGVLTYPYTISIEGLADVTGTMNAAATSTTLLNLIYDAIDAGVAANPTKPSLLLNLIASNVYLSNATNLDDVLQGQLDLAKNYAQKEADYLKTTAEAAGNYYLVVDAPTVTAVSDIVTTMTASATVAPATYVKGNVIQINTGIITTG